MKTWHCVVGYLVFIGVLLAVTEMLERDRLKRYPSIRLTFGMPGSEKNCEEVEPDKIV